VTVTSPGQGEGLGERLYQETVSITGGPGRGAGTDVASPYVGRTNRAAGSNGDSADGAGEPDRRGRQETLHLSTQRSWASPSSLPPNAPSFFVARDLDELASGADVAVKAFFP